MGKGVVLLICKDSSKSIRNRNNPDAKLASKEDEQTVPRQEEQMVLRHVKRCSTSLIEEMQSKLPGDRIFSPIESAKIKEYLLTTFIYCW